MITVNAKLEARGLLLRMERGQKKLAYATANALNDTAKEAQTAMRAQAQRGYEIRRPDFVLRQVAIIKPFASVRQGRPYAIISVGQKPRLLLVTLERGGVRQPVKGSRVAVPITGGPARPTFGSQVPVAFQFRQLKLKPTKGRRGLAKVRQGSQSTFVLDGPTVSQPGVYRRTGSALGDIELVYAFEAPMRLKPSLRFVETVTLAINRSLEANFDKQVRKELLR